MGLRPAKMALTVAFEVMTLFMTIEHWWTKFPVDASIGQNHRRV